MQQLQKLRKSKNGEIRCSSLLRRILVALPAGCGVIALGGTERGWFISLESAMAAAHVRSEDRRRHVHWTLSAADLSQVI